MSLRLELLQPEVKVAHIALAVLAATYNAFAEKEQDEVEAVNLDAYARAGRALRARFEGHGEKFPFGIELSPGDLSVFERALRMSAAASQSLIRLDQDRKDKDAYLAEVKEATDLLTKLRRARGLPW